MTMPGFKPSPSGVPQSLTPIHIFAFRTYVKQRAAIEKQYADSLLKLTNTFQHHRIAPIPDVNNPPPAGSGNQQPVQVIQLISTT